MGNEVNFFNSVGWDSVLTFIKWNPKIAGDNSLRTLAESNYDRTDGIAGTGYAA